METFPYAPGPLPGNDAWVTTLFADPPATVAPGVASFPINTGAQQNLTAPPGQRMDLPWTLDFTFTLLAGVTHNTVLTFYSSATANPFLVIEWSAVTEDAIASVTIYDSPGIVATVGAGPWTALANQPHTGRFRFNGTTIEFFLDGISRDVYGPADASLWTPRGFWLSRTGVAGQGVIQVTAMSFSNP